MDSSVRVGIKVIIWWLFFMVLFILGLIYYLDTPIRTGVIVSVIAGIGYVILLESEFPLIRESLKKLRRIK